MSQTIHDAPNAPSTDRDDKLFAALNYGLFLLGNVIGLTTLIALIIAYARRPAAPHWLQSHYTFQIRTFWIAVAGFVASSILIMTLLLSPIGALGMLLTWVWILVRAVVGLVRLIDGRGHPDVQTYWI